MRSIGVSLPCIGRERGGDMRVVHENSERDIAVAALGRELRAFSAQLLRIIAGAGDISGLMNTWRDLIRVIDDWPKGEYLPMHHELSQLLRPEFDRNDFNERFYEQATRGALRLVASKYQGLLTQERTAETLMLDAIRYRAAEMAAERRQTPSRSSERDYREAVEYVRVRSLTPAMGQALSYIGSFTREERMTSSRPTENTLKALLRRKMIAREPDGVLGYRLTRLGRRALTGQAGAPEPTGWGE